MATTTPLAYNTGSTIPGTTQIGDLAVGTTDQDYSTNPGGVTWWMGPDEDLGYVIGFLFQEILNQLKYLVFLHPLGFLGQKI